MTVQLVQGDILLVRVEDDDGPNSAQNKVVPSDGVIVVARGERTGHAHTIEADKAELWRDSSAFYGDRLVVMADTEMVHQEHPAMPIPAGTYRLIRQRRYLPMRRANALD